MNVLILCHNFRHHGSFFRAEQVARHYVERGHRVTFIHFSQTKRFRPEIRRDGALTVVESPHHSWLMNPQEGWGLADWLARWRRILGGRFDLVLGFGHKPNILLPARHCQFWQRSFVVTDWCDLWGGREGLIRQVILPGRDYRGRWLPTRLARRMAFGVESLLEKRFCRKSPATLVISDWLRERCLERGVPAERVARIYSGCDTKRILPQNRIHCLDDLELELTGRVLGYIGNVHPDEPILLEAFARICERRDDVTLLVAGAGFECDVAERYGAKLAGRIVHLGRVPFERISRILGACDLLLLPMADVDLNRARWPHKFTDYLAAGRPVVATDVGDTAAFVKRDGLGALARPEAEDFAERILELIDAPERWTEMGANARRLAEGELSWETQLKLLDDFLERLGALSVE